MLFYPKFKIMKYSLYVLLCIFSFTSHSQYTERDNTENFGKQVLEIEKLVSEKTLLNDYKVLIVPKNKKLFSEDLLIDKRDFINEKAIIDKLNLCPNCDYDKMVVPLIVTPIITPEPGPTGPIKPTPASFSGIEFCKKYPNFKSCRKNDND
jgi:hypothetical protein